MRLRTILSAATVGAALVSLHGEAQASSHREAPFITKNPKVDASDFYIFNSYETGKTGFVTIIANYEPLQDPAGGPNFFALDPQALYEIHIDNNGDAKEDITFQFRFQNNLINTSGIELPIGPADAGADSGLLVNNAVPFINVGSVPAGYNAGVFVPANSNQQYAETYTVTAVSGDRRAGTATPLTDGGNGNSTTFYKPIDNIGEKSFGAAPAYANYASTFVRPLNIPSGALPGCTATGARVFVGQRKEGFAVNLGTIFDLVDATAGQVTGATAAGWADNAAGNIFNTKNVTSIALEIPASCLVGAAPADGGTASPIIGAWTTASVRQARVINPTATYASPSVEGGAWAQVSRLGMPLVNEVVIGLKDKDRFNSSEPSGDAQFLPYVTNPTLAKVLDILFGPGLAPTVFPRADLVAAFLTGVEDAQTDGTMFNVNNNGATAEYVRLNTAVPATPAATQLATGAAGCFVDPTPAATTPGLKVLNLSAATCDPAGFPNGRRPGDDIVDIELRVMMGALFNSDSVAPARAIPFTDGATQKASQFATAFPYLNTPISGQTVAGETLTLAGQ